MPPGAAARTVAGLPQEVQKCTRRLCVLLRLAALLHRGRSAGNKPMLLMEVDGKDIRLSLPEDWLETHPLTRMELEEEAERLREGGFSMSIA